jgi:predicted enzyme related to lactoylglutathione lyase
MPRPVYFEIPAENPERLISFYESIFGWTFKKWEHAPMAYWTITTGPESEPGINGGLMQRQDPQQPWVNTITVSNVDATVAEATAKGAQVALAKMPVPGIGWLAYLMDPERNVIGIMQPDANAK